DQSFVAGLVGESRPESVAVVRAIQALAGTLGIHTIGEGVETQAQRAVLSELGCTYGQGYLFGRPAERVRGELRLTEMSEDTEPALAQESAAGTGFDEPDFVEHTGTGDA
ncbi:MAG: EAL domain-containing protein, partial [Lysobacter sp.]